jgi:hypothetical protein
MRTRRLIVAPAVLAMACSLLLAAGPAALGKDNVTARLLTPLRLDAAAGEQLTVAWVLAGTDEHGQHQPFNAIGIFVRLRSASGGRPTVGLATPDAHPQGRYDAQVAVPEGGIGGIQIGLGDAGNVGVGETLFPLENDPFAAPGRRVDRPVPAWLALAGGLALLGVLGTVGWRARWRTVVR